MNRGQARARLRRRLQESVEDHFDDDTLNTNLNLGVTEMQKEIMKVDPAAFIFIDRTDQVKETTREFYEFPAGFWYEREMRLKDTSSGKYVPIERCAFHERLEVAEQSYYRLDSLTFGFAPGLTTDLVAGIELVWSPTLAMAEDSDVIPLHLGLHEGVVCFAELISTPDTGDENENTVKELARIVNSIPQFYLASGASTPSHFSVGIDKGYE